MTGSRPNPKSQNIPLWRRAVASLRRWMWPIVITSSIILVLIPGWIFLAEPLGTIALASFFVGKIQMLAPISGAFAWALALLLAFLYMQLIPGMFSLDKEHRKGSWTSVVILTIVLFTISGFAQRNYNFNPSDGSALSRVAVSPDQKLKFFKGDISYDPVTGAKLSDLTPEEYDRWARSPRGGQALLDRPDLEFFDSYTGNPIKWFMVNPRTEKIEIFKYDGKDPLFGIDLLPVTSDIVIKYLDQLDAEAAEEKKAEEAAAAQRRAEEEAAKKRRAEESPGSGSVVITNVPPGTPRLSTGTDGTIYVTPEQAMQGKTSGSSTRQQPPRASPPTPIPKPEPPLPLRFTDPTSGIEQFPVKNGQEFVDQFRWQCIWSNLYGSLRTETRATEGSVCSGSAYNKGYEFSVATFGGREAIIGKAEPSPATLFGKPVSIFYIETKQFDYGGVSFDFFPESPDSGVEVMFATPRQSLVNPPSVISVDRPWHPLYLMQLYGVRFTLNTTSVRQYKYLWSNGASIPVDKRRNRTLNGHEFTSNKLLTSKDNDPSLGSKAGSWITLAVYRSDRGALVVTVDGQEVFRAYDSTLTEFDLIPVVFQPAQYRSGALSNDGFANVTAWRWQ